MNQPPVPSEPPTVATKRLLVMRHAKSDWSGEELRDHDRPLNKRGRRDAPEMALWLQSVGLSPDLVLCSSALRTRQTAELLAEHLPHPLAVSVMPQLYAASALTIAEAVQTNGTDVPCLMVLGHNPGVSEFVSHLARRFSEMATAAIAVFELNLSDWQSFDVDHSATLLHLMRPKALSL